MSRRCELTGVGPMIGHNVSHSNIKTKRWQRLNIQSRRLFVPELGRFVRLNVTTRDLRSIDKLGFWPFLTKTLDRRFHTVNPNSPKELNQLCKKLGIEIVFDEEPALESLGSFGEAAAN